MGELSIVQWMQDIRRVEILCQWYVFGLYVQAGCPISGPVVSHLLRAPNCMYNYILPNKFFSSTVFG